MNKLSVIQNCKTVESFPYPYVAVDNALPQNVYTELEKSFPEDLVCSTDAGDEGICYRYKSRQAHVDAVMPAIWEDFFEFHTSPEYFRDCAKLFEKGILQYYGEEFYENLITDTVGVRKLSKGKHVTDCQLVVHEPVDQTSTSRTPHLDNPKEIYAGLLYMKKDIDKSAGGNFTIHQTIKEVKSFKPLQTRVVEDDIHIPHVEIPYKANSFGMFLNVAHSVHSVTPRIDPIERRRSVNIIGEFMKHGRMWEVEP